MKLIEYLQWRYATKKFNPNRKIRSEDLEKIKESVQLSASSYGLQLYKVLIIEDATTRKALREASWGQPQITDASHLFVFCNRLNVTDKDIDTYLELKANIQGLDPSGLQDYGDFMKQKLGSLTEEQQGVWTARQVYIALGNLLAACGELNVDSCPMEGFDPAQYDEILGLKEKGLSAAVVAAVGYRAEEDATQHLPKVRKPIKQLFETV